jgi:hypothetical protein
VTYREEAEAFFAFWFFFKMIEQNLQTDFHTISRIFRFERLRAHKRGLIRAVTVRDPRPAFGRLTSAVRWRAKKGGVVKRTFPIPSPPLARARRRSRTLPPSTQDGSQEQEEGRQEALGRAFSPRSFPGRDPRVCLGWREDKTHLPAAGPTAIAPFRRPSRRLSRGAPLHDP